VIEEGQHRWKRAKRLDYSRIGPQWVFPDRIDRKVLGVLRPEGGGWIEDGNPLNVLKFGIGWEEGTEQ
jgi:hypothetical protein